MDQTSHLFYQIPTLDQWVPPQDLKNCSLVCKKALEWSNQALSEKFKELALYLINVMGQIPNSLPEFTAKAVLHAVDDLKEELELNKRFEKHKPIWALSSARRIASLSRLIVFCLPDQKLSNKPALLESLESISQSPAPDDKAWNAQSSWYQAEERNNSLFKTIHHLGLDLIGYTSLLDAVFILQGLPNDCKGREIICLQRSGRLNKIHVVTMKNISIPELQMESLDYNQPTKFKSLQHIVESVFVRKPTALFVREAFQLVRAHQAEKERRETEARENLVREIKRLPLFIENPTAAIHPVSICLIENKFYFHFHHEGQHLTSEEIYLNNSLENIVERAKQLEDQLPFLFEKYRFEKFRERAERLMPYFHSINASTMLQIQLQLKKAQGPQQVYFWLRNASTDKDKYDFPLWVFEIFYNCKISKWLINPSHWDWEMAVDKSDEELSAFVQHKITTALENLSKEFQIPLINFQAVIRNTHP